MSIFFEHYAGAQTASDFGAPKQNRRVFEHLGFQIFRLEVSACICFCSTIENQLEDRENNETSTSTYHLYRLNVQEIPSFSTAGTVWCTELRSLSIDA